MARFSCRGFVDGLLNGLVIALPPVLNYGTPELQERVVPEVSPSPVMMRTSPKFMWQILSGKKYIALAITEAFAGSDTNGLQTFAVRDGDHWVITGTKK